jgi:hypothetical protein
MLKRQPAGKNQFYDVVQDAKARSAAGDPDCFYAEYPASVTGIMTEKELEAARRRTFRTTSRGRRRLPSRQSLGRRLLEERFAALEKLLRREMFGPDTRL